MREPLRLYVIRAFLLACSPSWPVYFQHEPGWLGYGPIVTGALTRSMHNEVSYNLAHGSTGDTIQVGELVSRLSILLHSARNTSDREKMELSPLIADNPNEYSGPGVVEVGVTTRATPVLNGWQEDEESDDNTIVVLRTATVRLQSGRIKL